MKRFPVWQLAATAFLCLLSLPGWADEPATATVVVFAAASLKNALDDVTGGWHKKTGQKAVVTYGGSNTLARQIEQGAPADLFISADTGWMKVLSDKGLTRKDSERELLANHLVLIAPRDSRAVLHIAPGFGLAAALGDGHLALCNPSVPAGEYGVASLQQLGVWPEVSSHVAQTENVRAALALVARGEAPFGIVYTTDASAEPGVRVIDTFPDATHPPIVYPVAQLRDSRNPAAASLLAYIESPEAKPYFEKQGFVVLGP